MRINKLWSKQKSEEAKRMGSRRVEEQWVVVVDTLWTRLRHLAPSHLISMAVRHRTLLCEAVSAVTLLLLSTKHFC